MPTLKGSKVKKLILQLRVRILFIKILDFQHNYMKGLNLEFVQTVYLFIVYCFPHFLTLKY